MIYALRENPVTPLLNIGLRKFPLGCMRSSFKVLFVYSFIYE